MTREDLTDCKENKDQVIDIEARVDKLPEVLGFIDGLLEAAGCSVKAQFEIDVAVEEIFVNIASYAYAPDTGNAVIKANVSPGTAIFTFIDHGKPFDPLEKKDPDTTLSAEERPIGGLGVYIVKKTMDGASYEYKDGCNILTIRKNI